MQKRRAFLAALIEWNAEHGRHLPWRACGDPYRVWISEIMLQQTTVTAVIPYFERFLAAFPTLPALAAAEESQVLRLWEGLGYYSRARNLHAAAQKLMTEHDGRFPREVAALQALPGIGRYTAGAIASFAFNEPAAIVEANTQRLYARLLGEPRDLKTTAVQQRLWNFAAELVTTKTTEPQGPGEINQALMDLGATLCTPTSPDCAHCPATRYCLAYETEQQNIIPRLPPRPQLTDVIDVTVAIEQQGCYLLRQRQPGERWAGLWDFPRYTVPTDADPIDVLRQQVHEQCGLDLMIGPQVTQFKHGVTRYRITLLCHTATVTTGTIVESEAFRWVLSEDFENYALSVTGRKFADWLIAARERFPFD
ncbi:A/G-specific adenine glycosylase [bacterium]|nr:A/G-specific adenine glycosylase [bacterium]